MSVNRALELLGISKSVWHSHTRIHSKPKTRTKKPSPQILYLVEEIGKLRPTYGTRRMAHELSRRLECPINRKKVQKIYRDLGWIEPTKTKKEIIKSASKPVRPSRPNELWETDITYVWCGKDRWCYCFNILDTFTRKWIGYYFDTSASADAAVNSIVNVMASERPDPTKLIIRSDNGTQYTSKKFRDTLNVLQIEHEFIWHHTPEQNGHIESFHKTLKKEYLWLHDFRNFQDAEVVIANAFRDYNESRIHSSLGYITPNEFVKSCRGTIK